MGFIHKRFGKISIEERSESFTIHPNYGYNEDGSEFSDALGSFGINWRQDVHPEFLNKDLDDLIAALKELKKNRAY